MNYESKLSVYQSEYKQKIENKKIDKIEFFHSTLNSRMRSTPFKPYWIINITTDENIVSEELLELIKEDIKGSDIKIIESDIEKYYINITVTLKSTIEIKKELHYDTHRIG